MFLRLYIRRWDTCTSINLASVWMCTCTSTKATWKLDVLLHVVLHNNDKDGYRNQIVACDVGVSLRSKTRSWSVVGVQVHHVMHTCIPPCFLLFFYNPYISPFNSKNFSFTCLHSFLLHYMFITWDLAKAVHSHRRRKGIRMGVQF